jgi:hypothetical protein
MFLFVFAFLGVILLVSLFLFSFSKARKPTDLPLLDVISYILTSVTVLLLVISTQGQINQVFKDVTGQDLDLSAARTELNLFLETQCGREPECVEVSRSILAIANPRGSPKFPSRVNTDVSRLPALAVIVNRYNDAFDQNLARSSIMFLSVGFWFAVFAFCGVIIGSWRRLIILRDAVAAEKS